MLHYRYLAIFILVLVFFTFDASKIYAQQTGTLVTSGVIFNPDSSAQVSRTQNTSIRVPVNLINPTQGWVAVRIKMGFPATTSLSPDPNIWDMSESDPSDLFFYYDVGSDTFHLSRRKNATGPTAQSTHQTFVQGEFKTIVAAWTATTLKISVDGGVFTTVNAAAGTIPAQAAFYIGSSAVQGSGRQPNSDYYWVAAGTGVLTDANASTIHSFGNTDKRRVDFPGNATFVWWANNNQYNNDGTVGSTNTPTPPSATNTRPPNTPTAGSGGKHVRLFIDGIDKGPWFSTNPIPVTNLSNGNHTLNLRLYNANNTYAGFQDTVTVNVGTIGTTNTVTPRPNSPTPTRPPGSTTTQGPQPTQPPGGSNPLTDCTKYGSSPKRIFLETQAWWMATSSIGTSEELPLNGIGGHAHTGTCFPQDQQVSGGTLHFDVRLMIHKGNRAKVEWLDIGVGPGGESLARVTLPNLTCAGAEDPKKQCEWWIPIDLDTSKVPSGYQELRFRFNVIQPNGERMFASTGWQAWYHGGTSNYRSVPWLEARGWYEQTAYLNARLLSPVPYTPVSGTWSPLIEMTPGSGGKPVATRALQIDARFNFDEQGVVYAAGNGSFKGTVNIDTTQLTNGPHCVAIRTSSIDVGGGTDTGVLQFPIIVNNPGRPSGNGKGGCQPGT